MTAKNKLLVILDGWGHSDQIEHNAIVAANTPNWDTLTKEYAHSLIKTSGVEVGLPSGQMGNSEVGHLTLGAGRVVKQELARINDDIKSGAFYKNKVLKQALLKTAENHKTVHILGLISDGGVHSHIDHISALLEMAKQNSCQTVYFHLFTDGRDTPPRSAKKYLAQLEAKMTELSLGKIVSLVGRYYAMDRDNRWQRVEKAVNLICKRQADFTALNAQDAIATAYQRGENDEFIQPTVVGEPITVAADDLFIAMNYRADRIRQLTQALTQDFSEFNQPFRAQHYVCLTEYKDTFNLPIAYAHKVPKNTLGDYVSQLGLRQLRAAETEKYAHVTFFFNGGREAPLAHEDRLLIPSPDVATYDLKPAMSAFELTDKLLEVIKAKTYHLIICNFANTDMVGHSGNLSAAIKAVEAVDACLGKLYQAINATAGEMLITADHGNAEQMRDDNSQQPHTAHTQNPVPLVFIGRQATLTDGGTLANIAPTILAMMDLEKPKEMTAESLLQFT